MNRRSLAFVAIGLCVFLAMASLVSARPFSLHTDSVVSFTSTADFDAGVKNQPSPVDGNLNVETITDNPGIATGALELASLKGDSFNTADTDGTTFKWTYAARGTGCDTHAISGGALHFAITANTASECLIGSVATISGDWDVRVKTIQIAAGSASHAHFCLYDTAAECGDSVALSGATNGVRYTWVGTTQLQAYTVSAGVATQVGLNTNPGSATVWLRMVKVGTTITWYWSTNGSSWTTDESTTFTVPANVHAVISFTMSGSVDGMQDFDDFYTALGTVGSGGFRAAGNWTSAAQTYTTEVASKIVVNYTIAGSGSPAIDYVKIAKASDGSTLYVDNTDITSGTTHTYTVTNSAALKTNWTVVIGLKGGAGTPTITNVDVTTAVPPVPPVPNPALETINLATSVVASLLVVMGIVIVFIAIYLVLFGVKDRFFDPSVYKRGKS